MCCIPFCFRADNACYVSDFANSVDLLLVSIKSVVINVCHLLNLLWSTESITPDTFSADISLLVALCIVSPY